MQKHIVDRPKAQNDGLRLRQYLKIEGEGKPSQATRDLQRQTQDRSQAGRLAAFLKIERGHVA